jgi:hypothetical protein
VWPMCVCGRGGEGGGYMQQHGRISHHWLAHWGGLTAAQHAPPLQSVNTNHWVGRAGGWGGGGCHRQQHGKWAALGMALSKTHTPNYGVGQKPVEVNVLVQILGRWVLCTTVHLPVPTPGLSVHCA